MSSPTFHIPAKTNFSAFIFLAFVCLVTLGMALTTKAQDDVVKVDSSIVVLNATIVDQTGAHVGGLQQRQFTVLEDGVEQEIEYFSSEKTPFAAVILLDTSGSMEERVSLARAAAIRFLDGLRIDDFAAIYNFDSKVSMVQDFSNSRDITEHVFDLKSNGMTVLNDAIVEAARQLSGRSEKRRAIVVLSDGMDTRSKYSTEKALKAAQAANALIYTVDMSSVDTPGPQRMQNRGVLKNLAEKTGGLFITTPGGAAMREAFKQIVEELGNQYTIAYQPTNARKDGKFRSIELRVAKPQLTIRTRKGYTAAKN
jgi:Ca-activated chloride channel family protein